MHLETLQSNFIPLEIVIGKTCPKSWTTLDTLVSKGGAFAPLALPPGYVPVLPRRQMTIHDSFKHISALSHCLRFIDQTHSLMETQCKKPLTPHLMTYIMYRHSSESQEAPQVILKLSVQYTNTMCDQYSNYKFTEYLCLVNGMVPM